MQKYNFYSLKTALQAFPAHFLTIIGLEIPHHPSTPLGKLGDRSGIVRNAEDRGDTDRGQGQVRVIFLRTELFPYLFPSDAPAARKCGGSYFIVSLNF